MICAYKPSRIESVGDCAIVHLNGGDYATIDLADVPLVQDIAWGLHKSGEGRRYVRWMRAGRGIYLHRFLMDAPDGLLVDHIDGDGLNCQRSNLRICTALENSRNRRPSEGRYKGVQLQKGRARFEAVICVEGRNKRLGSFPTAEDAARAYDAAAKVHHGEFARLNFPLGRTG